MRPAGRGAVDETLAEQEAEGELLVVAGRAHGDRQRLAVDADLHRLLDGHLVGLAVALDDGDGASGHQAVEHSERPDAEDQ